MPNIVGPLNFFVYVIESPSAEDLYINRSESSILEQATALNGIPCVSRKVVNRDMLRAALTSGMDEAKATYPGALPILHLSVHGAESGFGLSDRDFIQWDELREMLQPIHDSTGKLLLLCMSTCSGANAGRMAARFDEGQVPFFAVVGHTGQPRWSDTAVGYASFYHLVAKGAHIRDAVEAMKVATGDAGFCLIYAENIRGAFVEEFRRMLAALPTPASTVQPLPLAIGTRVPLTPPNPDGARPLPVAAPPVVPLPVAASPTSAPLPNSVPSVGRLAKPA